MGTTFISHLTATPSRKEASSRTAESSHTGPRTPDCPWWSAIGSPLEAEASWESTTTEALAASATATPAGICGQGGGGTGGGFLHFFFSNILTNFGLIFCTPPPPGRPIPCPPMPAGTAKVQEDKQGAERMFGQVLTIRSWARMEPCLLLVSSTS